MFKLWKHQEQAIELAANIRDLALFFDVGTGKSATAINIIDQKTMLEMRNLKVLIVCPVVVMRQWKAEIAKFGKNPLQKVILLYGTARQRIELFDKSPKDSIFIINFEGLSRIEPLYRRLVEWCPEILVVDEAHKVKSHNSLISRRLHFLSGKMEEKRKNKLEISHRYLLTGSPILNNEMDIWSQFFVLDQGKTFGANFFAFRNRYFIDRNRNAPAHIKFRDWKFVKGKEGEFKQKLATKSLVAKKEECLDLPDLVRVKIPVEFTKEQKKAYDEMRDDFLTFVDGEAVTALMAMTKALRLQQIASGFVNTENGKTIRFEETPREEALKELLEQLTEDGKVIVWSVFQNNYEVIGSVCDKLKLKWVELSGRVGGDKRFENVRAFQEDHDVRVLIGHPGSGGIGVNLTAAKYSIWWSRSFSLEHEIQATARNYRGGSEIHSKITRYDLVAENSLDEKVMEALAAKKDLADRLMDIKDFLKKEKK